MLRPTRNLQSAIPALLLLAGCGPRRPAQAPPPPPAAPPKPSAAPIAKGGEKRHLTPPARPGLAITAGAAGPVRIGMTAAEVRKLPNFTPVPGALKRGGKTLSILVLSQLGEPFGSAELEGDQVVRIRVSGEQYATPEGVHVGATARDLEKIYGPGSLDNSEGLACASFQKAPGLSFCFQPRKGLQGGASPEWAQVRKANPRVVSIVVAGSAPGD